MSLIPDGEMKFSSVCGRCGEMTFEGIKKYDGKVWAKYYIYIDCEHYEEHLDMFTMDELFVLCNAIDVTMGEKK